MGQISSGPVSSVAWVRGVDVSLEMLERDPYPAFASLQEFEPAAFVPSLDMWLVTRWDDVVYVCEHPELFVSNTEPSWLRDCLGENMLTLDGSAHDRLADGMRSPFVSSSALPVVRDGLPALFDELIDGFDSAGDVELMSAYAEPLANLTLAAALGWSVDWRDLAAWNRGVCIGTATRQAILDVELAGTLIPAGSLVAACLSAANRDPRRWSHPELFALERREGAHLAFATGEHRCLGEWLGRQQVRLAVDGLLDRFTHVELIQPVELTGFEFRGPLALHVRLQ